jgi:hypothetical protein
MKTEMQDVPQSCRKALLQVSYLLCNVLRRRCLLILWLLVLEIWGCVLCGRYVVLSQLQGWDGVCDTGTAVMSSNFDLDKAVLSSRSSKPTTCADPSQVLPLSSLYHLIVIFTFFLVTEREVE